MSEDALSWNVFVSLAAAGRLRQAAEHLTCRTLRTEPTLYLWGRKIDLRSGDSPEFPELLRVRQKLEEGITQFLTEPDVMLIAQKEMIICIEAKFGSGNPLAHEHVSAEGEKPHSRQGLIARYLEPSDYARNNVLPSKIGAKFHSQIFRNVVFASEMARELPWHVVNLVSRTQRGQTDNTRYSFADPSADVCCYLSSEHQRCFTYRTWETMHAELIRDDPELFQLDQYMRGKSAHFLPAFELN